MNNESFDIVRKAVADHSMTDDDRLLEQLRITRDKICSFCSVSSASPVSLVAN